MKLKIFNKENAVSNTRLSTKPLVRINGGNGAFTFNKAAIQQLKLTNANAIEFVLNEEENDWYVAVDKKGDKGFKLREDKDRHLNLIAQSSVMARTILNSMGGSVARCSLPIGSLIKHEGMDMYLLVTAGALNVTVYEE